MVGVAACGYRRWLEPVFADMSLLSGIAGFRAVDKKPPKAVIQ